MPPSPLVTKIGEASKDAWPHVTAALAMNTRSMQELAPISEEVVPRVEEYVARGKNGALRRRKVCEETIWVLASLGWLRTGPERHVLLAARAYVDAINADDAPGTDMLIENAEDKLVEAVDSLPEYMTAPHPKES